MRREFDYFDDDIIIGELEAMPARDAAKLIVLMNYFEGVGLADPSPAMIDDYGNGIKRIRHIKSAYQGRGLFYVGESEPGFQKLWLLTVYKKEGQDMPKNVFERAIQRKATHEAKLNVEKKKKL